MLRKLSFLMLLVASVSAVICAQQLPAPRSESRNFVFSGAGGGYLGVQMTEVSSENFAKYGLNDVRGVAVEKVVENSPAAQAGIQTGDVILKFDGEQVSSIRKLTRLLMETAPDHKANLTVFRGGSEREISVTVGKRESPNFELSNLPSGDFSMIPSAPQMPRMSRVPFPNGESRGFIYRASERRQIGINVTPLTAQLGEYFGAANGKGLLVDSVLDDSPAAKAGLKAGDVITEADGKTVAGNSDLIRAVNAKKEGSVTLTIIRDKKQQTLNVTPETVKGTAAPYFEEFDEFNPPSNFKIIVPPNAPQALVSPRVN